MCVCVTYPFELIILSVNFQDHWFPENPDRGQAFRCIRINSNSRPDPLIEKAAFDTGIEYCDLRLPVEFTMWVDPKEVSCRYNIHCYSMSFLLQDENVRCYQYCFDDLAGSANTKVPIAPWRRLKKPTLASRLLPLTAAR